MKLLFFILIIGLSCHNKTDELISASADKQKSIGDRTFVCNYMPNKNILYLFNGYDIKIDTPWGGKSYYLVDP